MRRGPMRLESRGQLDEQLLCDMHMTPGERLCYHVPCAMRAIEAQRGTPLY
jgi:hypothetical protein